MRQTVGFPSLDHVRKRDSLDRINGSIRERTHRTGDQPDRRSLPSWKSSVRILGLPFLQQLLELGVSGEVGGCLVEFNGQLQLGRDIREARRAHLDSSPVATQ